MTLNIINSCLEEHEKSRTDIVRVDIGTDVTSIGVWAFQGCTNLVNVTIPDSVNYIYEKAFFNCTSLLIVTFEGNAPVVGSNGFAQLADGCTAYVRRDSSGWGVNSPGTWNGINISYID